MGYGAAGGDRQDGFSRKCELRKQIEKYLQQARIRRLENRRCDHDAISLLDRRHGSRDADMRRLCRNQRFRVHVPEANVASHHGRFAYALQHAIRHLRRLGRWRRAARYREDQLF
jgi:hypothetical protein